jgi:hypothetical protein
MERNEPSRPTSSRRRVLQTAGGITAFWLAGCSSVTNYEFIADPAVLPSGARERLGYRERLREAVVAERSRSVGGVEVAAVVESHVAVYEPAGEREGKGGTAAAPLVGAASTPAATVRGQSFNPLARLSLSNFVASEAGQRFLRRAGLDEVGHPRNRVRWARGPTLLGGREGTCLDRPTKLETHAGVVDGDPPSVAFVHLTRVDADSVVIAAAVHGHDIGESGRQFVGPGSGYLAPAEHDAAVELFGEATEGLRYA